METQKRTVIATKEPKAFKPLDVVINDLETVINTGNYRIVLEGQKADEFIKRIMNDVVKPLDTYVNYQEEKVKTGGIIVSSRLKEIGSDLIAKGERIVTLANKAEKLQKGGEKQENAPRAYRQGEIESHSIKKAS
jgi:hypothetical protein